MSKNNSPETLSSLLEELRRACIRQRMPYYVGIVKSNDAKTTHYYTNLLSPTVLGISLNHDLITPQLLIMNGFDTAEPNNIPDYDKPESVRNNVRPVFDNHFDFEAGIKSSILPIVGKIEAICHKDKLPYIIILTESDMDGQTVYQIRKLMPAELKIRLTDDRLEKVTDVIAGMLPVSPIYMPTVIDEMFEFATTTEREEDEKSLGK